jgi:hypothetical protein
MRRKLFAVCFALSTMVPTVAYGQVKGELGACRDLPGVTSATHRFQHLGETIEFPIRGEGLPPGRDNCEAIALSLHWSNGRNNGSIFNVIFLDANDRPIFAKQISGFLSGVAEFPLASFELQRVSGSSLGVISVPTRISIQTVRPFAPPATVSYRVISVPHTRGQQGGENPSTLEPEEVASSEDEERGNAVVSIHNAVRLIGATRLLLIQIELKTDRPFPAREVPLRLQIGKKVFSDELSGDYTGRRLTLSLTPQLFAELNEGDEIVAFFERPERGESCWNFGKLRKAMHSSE